MPRLSIIILSYNTRKITEQCLTSLLKSLQTEHTLIYEIIVVDNGSNDGSVNMLQNYKLQTTKYKLILNTKNIGFSKANNQALKIVKGEYVLFLNSDVLIEKVSFNRLLNYFDSRPDVGVLTVRVNRTDGSIDPASHRGFPTIWNSLCYFLKLEKLADIIPFVNKIFGGYHLIWNDLQMIHEIDSPSGAFYLVRKEIFDAVKGFDEQFFMYGEDLDLSYRIKELGYKILYYPFFHVTHLKYMSGLGTQNGRLKKAIKRHFYEAMKIFYVKHYAKKHSDFTNKAIYRLIDLKARL
ncbi:glycosyltransferase family 2 protein [Candidatus Roizmanbacteria bacterium]|nr:glycosyltransferase family 2 protein [Candidatus Roizmanbacteria bacterium]